MIVAFCCVCVLGGGGVTECCHHSLTIVSVMAMAEGEQQIATGPQQSYLRAFIFSMEVVSDLSDIPTVSLA